MGHTINGTARACLRLFAVGAVVFLGACGSGGSGATGGAGGGGHGGSNLGGAGSSGAAGTNGMAGTPGTGGAGTAGAAGTTGGAGAAGAAGTTGGAGTAGAAGAAGGAGTTGGAGTAGAAGSAGSGGAAGSGAAGHGGGGGGNATTDAGVDAAPAVCGTGTACGADLSNVGTGDFCISFTLDTKQTQGETALLNQRSSCGFSNFWDIRAGLAAADAGASASWLEFEADVDSSANDISLGSPPNPFVVVLNDNRPHAVIVKRVSGVVTIAVDGTSMASKTIANSFGSLPALAQGTDVCDGIDGTHALTGSLVDVCITH
jgi:hypothetical protein